MAEHKSFLVYKDWSHFVEYLSDEDAGRLFKALFEFTINGSLTDFSDSPVKPVFNFMVKHIEENEVKYQQKCEILAKNAAKGGRPKKSAVSDETDFSGENQMVSNADICEQEQADDSISAEKAKNQKDTEAAKRERELIENSPIELFFRNQMVSNADKSKQKQTDEHEKEGKNKNQKVSNADKSKLLQAKKPDNDNEKENEKENENVIVNEKENEPPQGSTNSEPDYAGQYYQAVRDFEEVRRKCMEKCRERSKNKR